MDVGRTDSPPIIDRNKERKGVSKMKCRVTAKITDSPIVPVETFFAEKEFDFSDDSNVFGRVLEVRTYFKTTYKTDNVEITKVLEI